MSATGEELIFPAWRRALAYVTVAVMPLSLNVEKLLQFKDKHYLSPLDFLLPVLLLLLLYDLWKDRMRFPLVAFRSPPLPSVLWAGLVILSCTWVEGFPHGDTKRDWVFGAQAALQFGLIGVWVFQNVAHEPAEYRKLALILGGSMGVCLLFALKQYVGPQGLPYDPANKGLDLGGVTNVRLAGWYEYRGILGAQVAMIAPAAAAFAVFDRDSAVRAIAFGIAALSLFVTISVGGFLGAVAGIIAVAGALSAARGKNRMALIMLAFLAVIVAGMTRLPRDNAKVLIQGASLYVGESGQKVPSARLKRYQASLDLLASPSDPSEENSTGRWFKGVGTGQYQHEVDRFYQFPYRRPNGATDDEALFDTATHEPFTFGLFEKVTVELGVFGMVVLAFLFAVWIGSACSAFARLIPPPVASEGTWVPGKSHDISVLALAALGAGTGACVLSIFGSPVVRGPGGTFAFFFALAICTRRWSTVPP
jgi:hypothetical protein